MENFPVIEVVSIIVTVFVTWLSTKLYYQKLEKKAKEVIRSYETIPLRDQYYMTNLLSLKIKQNKFIPDAIFSISPGGNMIGEWLSRKFIGNQSKPIILHNLWMEAKRGDEGQHLTFPEPCGSFPNNGNSYQKILLVNDISRSGRTLEIATRYMKQHFPHSEINTAVLFMSSDSSPPYPNYWIDKPHRRVEFEWKV
ncbi:MAG TPA: hypothetical protein PKW95_22710 [bacterium]|nr:hypothetical protein [bacterium]